MPKTLNRLQHSSLLTSLAILFLAISAYFSPTLAEEAKPVIPLYYDPISGKLLTPSQVQMTQTSELIFLVKKKKFDIGELFTFEHNNNYWVSIQEVIDLFDFPITLSSQTTENNQLDISANGWYIKASNNFSISTDKTAATWLYNIDSANGEFTFYADKLNEIEGEFYFPLNNVLEWFGVTPQINKGKLEIHITSKELFPFEKKDLRNQRGSSALIRDFDLQTPERNSPYKLWAPIFTDVQINANHRDEANQYSASALGSGDLLYMTGRYFLGAYRADTSTKTNLQARLSLERNDMYSSLLGPLKATHVSVGDISPTAVGSIPSQGAGLGFRVSNKPFGRITQTATTDITGFQQPGWDVEVYLNNIYQDSQTIDETGQYQFTNLPLSIGLNEFTLKFYGPQGEVEQETQTYNLSREALTGKTFIYDLSVVRQNTQVSSFIDNNQLSPDDHYGLNLHLEKGISDNISLSTDFSHFHLIDGVRHQYVQPGVRFFTNNLLVVLNQVQDLDGGNQSKASVSTSVFKEHKINYAFTNSTQDFTTSGTASLNNKKHLHNVKLNGPFPKNRLFHSNYSFTASRQDNYDQSILETQSYGLGFSFGRLQLGANLNNAQSISATQSKTNQQSASVQASFPIKSLHIRNNLQYSLKPTHQLNTSKTTVSWYISNNLNTTLGYDYNFANNTDQKSIALNWSNRHIATGFKINQSPFDTSASLNIRFSLTHNPLNNRFEMSSNRVSHTGAVAALVFEDKNNNQRFDEGEFVIPDAEIVATQQHKKAKTDASGIALLSGLYTTEPTDIVLESASLDDPFWVPSTKGFSFLPRPGLMEVLIVPVVTAGEIEGTVRFSSSIFNPSVEQGRVPMLLTNLTTGETYNKETSFDGFYLFNTVPPGDYQLEINPDFLEKRELSSRSPIKLTIDHRGTLLMGMNFELHLKGKYAVEEQSFELNTAYNIDFGTFASEYNARVVLGALRSVFPNLLNTINNESGFEMLLTKQGGDSHALALGPFRNVNHIKHICGELSKENLTCKAQKVRIQPSKPAAPAAEPVKVEPVTTPTVENNIKDSAERQSDSNEPLTNYTIQWMSTHNKAGLEKFIQEKALKNAKIRTIGTGSKTRYILTTGSYPTRTEASIDADIMEERLNIKPWLRTFQSINIAR